VGFRAVNTADMVNQIQPGQVRKDGGQFVEYFTGLTTVAQTRPNFGTGADATTLGNRFANLMVVDASGNVIFRNPEPGQIGNTKPNLPGLDGPAQLGFDLSLAKKINLSETKFFTFRANVIDALNRPIWGNPNMNLNNVSFGRITTAGGARSVTLDLRFDF
jgi:hypothetical protein